jgi:hypothetical protein
MSSTLKKTVRRMAAEKMDAKTYMKLVHDLNKLGLHAEANRVRSVAKDERRHKGVMRAVEMKLKRLEK